MAKISSVQLGIVPSIGYVRCRNLLQITAEEVPAAVTLKNRPQSLSAAVAAFLAAMAIDAGAPPTLAPGIYSINLKKIRHYYIYPESKS